MIARGIHEPERNVARTIAATSEFLQSRYDRNKAEMLFAHLKRILKLDRLRLRGLSGAQDEFLMAATAQNLRRMAKWWCQVLKRHKQCPLEGIPAAEFLL
jgi:transposase